VRCRVARFARVARCAGVARVARVARCGPHRTRRAWRVRLGTSCLAHRPGTMLCGPHSATLLEVARRAGVARCGSHRTPRAWRVSQARSCVSHTALPLGAQCCVGHTALPFKNWVALFVEFLDIITMPDFNRKHLPHDVPDWVEDGSTFFITVCCQTPAVNQLCHLDQNSLNRHFLRLVAGKLNSRFGAQKKPYFATGAVR